MSVTDADRAFMALAVAKAFEHFGQTEPNPSVGCVIVRGGVILSTGVTGIGGRPHAEQVALDQLHGTAEGATAYVTLEPCRERSTGEASCSERLASSGIARVVYAAADRHPKGSGGAARLHASGIEVVLCEMTEETEVLYGDFFSGI